MTKIKKIKTEIAIIGAGPAGLAAAIVVAKLGAKVILLDENNVPGGQLVKQIHKFFGSSRHKAGIRGINIAKELVSQCRKYNVELFINAMAYGILDEHSIGVLYQGKNILIQAKKIIIATGALENFTPFKGWSLPGVMGAGALQTMMNLHHVLPGKRILMIGAGNVGLIVSFQVIQAGAKVISVVEALPKIGGYLVHAAKLKRTGVPILTSHTIKEVIGTKRVEGAVIAEIDRNAKIITDTEKKIDVDTVCISIGLSPLTELAWMAGCKFAYLKGLGGFIPLHDCNMRTTKKDIFIAGDISGIEEASTAIEEGRLAGYSVAEDLGFVKIEETKNEKEELINNLCLLRKGPFGESRKVLKEKLETYFLYNK